MRALCLPALAAILSFLSIDYEVVIESDGRPLAGPPGPPCTGIADSIENGVLPTDPLAKETIRRGDIESNRVQSLT